MLVMISSVNQPDAPPGEAVARRMTFNDELVHAGALLALDGLYLRARGACVACVGGKPNMTDGLFTAATDVSGGDGMNQANSQEAVAEWARRCPASDSEVIEVRGVFERSDFPRDVQKAADHPAVCTPIEPRQGA